LQQYPAGAYLLDVDHGEEVSGSRLHQAAERKTFTSSVLTCYNERMSDKSTVEKSHGMG
jgi:hypothetical protein